MKKELQFLFDENTQCMECISHSLDKDGYVDVKRSYNGYKVRRAHRIIYFLHFGMIPTNKVIRHLCNNRKCCNPLHLLEGSQGENIQDKYRENLLTGD